MKLIEKIPGTSLAKVQYYQFIRKKKRNSAKQSEILNYQPKTFENPNIADYKKVIAERPKISQKLSKTIRQAEKVGFNSYLSSDEKQRKIFKQKHILKKRENMLLKVFEALIMLKC